MRQRHEARRRWLQGFGTAGDLRHFAACGIYLALLLCGLGARATILWSEPGEVLVHDSGPGRDLINGALKRDDASKDTLYFRFHVSPLSDASTEEYFAAFELFEGETERLGIGNALAAYAYSAFFKMREPENANPAGDYLDLHSASVEPAGAGTTSSYELPRRGQERTIVFKVQYVPNGDDLITVWLNPDLSAGATEIQQPEALTTRFSANASFDEIRLRHAGRGDGWVFSDLAIATAFADFVAPSRMRSAAADSGRFFELQPFDCDGWLRDAGMPRAAIGCLAQTADGYLWLAGGNQLARFDGVRFVALSLPTEFGSGTITSLLGDSHGALWLGISNRGLARYSGSKFEFYQQGLPASNVTAIAEGKSSTLWVGTAAGIVACDNGNVHKVKGLEPLDGSEIRTVLVDEAGTVWIVAAGKGVFQFQNGGLAALSDAQVSDLLPNVRSLVCDRVGRLWLGAGDDFVLCRENTNWHRYRIPRQVTASPVTTLAETPDGTVWAGSASEGLFRIKHGKLNALNSTAGLPENQPAALLADREGNLWVGGSSGLHRLRPKRCFVLGQTEGLGHGTVSGLVEVSPGVIWAAQPGRGLYRWEGDTFRRLTATGLSPSDSALGPILVTRDRACWLACTNGLLLFRDPQAVADESQLFELPHASISALAEGSDGSIWAGTWQGQLWLLRQGRWREHQQFTSPFGITVLAIGPNGNIWVGTDGGGLYRVDELNGGRATRVDGCAGDFVRALLSDDQGTLWVATADHGLAAFSNQSCAQFSISAAVPDNGISGILEDRAGRLWLNDVSGITSIAKPSPTSHSIEVLGNCASVSGRGEGFSVRDRSSLPQLRESGTGRLWFASLDGIRVAEPQDTITNSPTAPLILEEVLVDGVPAIWSGKSHAARAPALLVGPGRHRLEFHYTCAQFSAPENLRFRYRLEGLEQNWIEAGGSRVAQYSYVPPGDYHFTVELTRPGGRNQQTSIGLSVSAHFWQQRWAMAATALGLVAAIAAGMRLVENRRMKRRVRRLEQQNLLERERMRIARDLHDEMGAKLCRISFLSEHANRVESGSGQMKEQVATIAHDSRELLHSLDEIVWAVNPHNDTLEHVGSYIGQYAQEYFQSTGITCFLDVPSDLPHHSVSSQVRHHVFLAVHEALTNVLKHSRASHVKITVAGNNRTLRIKVEDDGRGFVPAAMPLGSGNSEETGNGIRNMQQRIEAVGGKCLINSRPGQGTTVEFVLRMEDPVRDEKL